MSTTISDLGSDYGFDMENRDPMHKNDHVRVWFNHAFAEPDGTHTIDGVWNCSFKTFNGAKRCCYVLLSVLCGGPCALLWGLLFACQSFFHIWCIGPCFKSWLMELKCDGLFWKHCVSCCCDPVYEAIGKIFGNIRLHHIQSTDDV